MDPTVDATTRVQLELAEDSEALELPRLPPNGLRHAAAHAPYKTGEVDVTASIMGHRPKTAIRIYREVTSDERERVVKAKGGS